MLPEPLLHIADCFHEICSNAKALRVIPALSNLSEIGCFKIYQAIEIKGARRAALHIDIAFLRNQEKSKML